MITYAKLNTDRLAQPPHHRRPRSQPAVIPAEYTPGYPQPSTTNQRRRLTGHRGNGSVHTSIQRRLPADENGHRALQPMGIWRGLDWGLAKTFQAKYTGDKLRAIRAIKGVGRPWVTLLPSALELAAT